MRLLGFTLAVLAIGIGKTLALAQPPGGAPLPPAQPPAVAPQAPNLDAHLAGWEQNMSAVKNFVVKIALTRTDSVFKKEKKYTGSVACMKPNLAVLRLEYTQDPKDYEALICDGKSFFVYNGLEKSITEHKIPNAAANLGAAPDNLM